MGSPVLLQVLVTLPILIDASDEDLLGFEKFVVGEKRLARVLVHDHVDFVLDNDWLLVLDARQACAALSFLAKRACLN